MSVAGDAGLFAAQRGAPDGPPGAACTHCGLPVPAGLIEAGAARPFCCGGCRAVYELIHECGLERFYRLRGQDNWSGAASRATGARYDDFDHERFLALHCRAAASGLPSVELRLEGVHCAACVWLLEKLPRVAAGVVEARLDLRRASLQLVWDPRLISLSAIARHLDRLGYPPHPARGTTARELRRTEERRFLIRIAVAGAAAGNVMLLALALYAGLFSSMEPEYVRLFRWLSMLIAGVSLAWPGAVFFRGAWAALRTRTAHLDLPIALGLGVGALAGGVNTVLNRGEIYFDSLTALVFLLLVGRWLQYRQQRAAADSVEWLFSLTPTAARVVDESDAGGGRIVAATTESLRPGQLVEVRANESIPADGVVETGESSVDVALLSGESRPIGVAPGSDVCAGAVNLASSLRVRVRAAGAETRIGRLLQLVEDSLLQKAPIVQFANRISGHFTAALLVLAAFTIAYWSPVDFARGLDHAVALLIVACPCALGLATPLTLAVAIGRAAQRGILIKGGAALEQLARPGTLLLDKTGTLTSGRVELLAWYGEEAVKPLVAAVEAQSSHPVARAFVAAFGNPVGSGSARARQLAAGGLSGEAFGRALLIGSPDFVASTTGSLPDWANAHVDAAVAIGRSPVVVAVDGVVAGVAAFGDPLRPDAAPVLNTLRRLGWRLEILSGDHAAVVEAVGHELGVEPGRRQGGVTPESKLAVVRARAAGGPVVMVGDGVNDAAALAAASVGIAVHGGAEASLAAADVYVNRPGLAPIAELMHAARRTAGVIRRNFAISLGYNIVAAGLAMTGVLNPLMAAVLMPLSSLTVLSLSTTARTFGNEPCQ